MVDRSNDGSPIQVLVRFFNRGKVLWTSCGVSYPNSIKIVLDEGVEFNNVIEDIELCEQSSAFKLYQLKSQVTVPESRIGLGDELFTESSVTIPNKAFDEQVKVFTDISEPSSTNDCKVTANDCTDPRNLFKWHQRKILAHPYSIEMKLKFHGEWASQYLSWGHSRLIEGLGR